MGDEFPTEKEAFDALRRVARIPWNTNGLFLWLCFLKVFNFKFPYMNYKFMVT